MMTTLTGTYYNGQLKLDQPIKTTRPIKVTISFEEEGKLDLKLSDFSFLETQKLLKDCKSSFADEIIEGRRKEI